MNAYGEASQLKETLKGIINETVENNPLVKSAIKAKKATVESVNTANKTVVVRFPFDTTLVTLPYNPQMERYLTTGNVKGKVVSVWFYQDVNNGIVMQDGSWSIYVPMPTISFAAGRTYNGGKAFGVGNPLVISINILNGNLKEGDEITLLEPKLSTRTPTNEFHDRRHRMGVIAYRSITAAETNSSNIAIAISTTQDNIPSSIQDIAATYIRPKRIGKNDGLAYLRIRRKISDGNGTFHYYFSNLIPIRITMAGIKDLSVVKAV